MGISTRIAGGTVMTPGGAVDGDLLIDDEGLIAGIVAGGVHVEAGETVDATGKLVLPGMIDVHVHTREPGYEYKEDIRTTSMQAAAGGVTTIFGMPNLKPSTIDRALLDDVLDRYARTSIVDYNHNPAATDPDKIADMVAAGVRAFKIFMVVDTGRDYPHPPGTGMHNHGHLLQMMEAIAGTGVRFIIHPHDQGIMDFLEERTLAAGENTPEGYAKVLAAYEGVIWDTAIDIILRLSEATGCPIHIAHMQTRRSIDAVRRAKARGIDVTCEVNHWAPFLSTWNDVQTLGPYALSYWVPDDARAAVWEGLNDGTIDMISSDHAPNTRDEKEIGWTEMWSAHTGTPGIQYYFSLLLDAVTKGRIGLERFVEATATRPADSFGLSATKGRLAVGKHADVVIADMKAPWTIRNEGVLSKIGWTCYDGRELDAQVLRTYVRGHLVYADGRVVGEPGTGRQAVAVPAERVDP